jgi:hypothetical protein
MKYSRWPVACYWTLVATVFVETITVVMRFSTGMSATQISGGWPILFRIHHMFWGVAVLVASFVVWKNPRWWGRVFGIGLGLVLSDAIHHLIVLPLTVGNMGWHWP